jgi:hypothetical protein
MNGCYKSVSDRCCKSVYDRYEFLKNVWKIADQNNVEIETESIAIKLAEKYHLNHDYTKELAYVSLALCVKLNQDNYISYVSLSSRQLELDLINLNFKKHYFLDDLIGKMKILNIDKRLGPKFIHLIRYLTWHDINANFYTIILAFQIMNKKFDFYIKYHKLYQLFVSISKMYDVTVESLIDEYRKIKL